MPPTDIETASDTKEKDIGFPNTNNEKILPAGDLQDAVFGEIREDGPNYRAVGWMGTAVLMIKTQVGLGVLGIPFVLSTLGIVPGTICLLGIGIITTWSDYVVGQFKLRHPTVCEYSSEPRIST